MARAKKTAAKSAGDPKIIRNFDEFSLEKRVFNMDHAKNRSWDIYSIEKRIYELEKNGGGGGSSTYKVKLGTAITGTNVTLEKDKFYLFSSVYNTGSFTNADIVLGKKGSLYIKDEIGRMICIIRATNTSVSFSAGGDVAPNKFVPITIEKNGEDITAFVFGSFEFSTGTSISSAKNERYVVATSDLSETFTGAEVEGTVDMGITTGAADTKIYIIKATGDTISYGNKSIYYDRLVGGDIFA